MRTKLIFCFLLTFNTCYAYAGFFSIEDVQKNNPQDSPIFKDVFYLNTLKKFKEQINPDTGKINACNFGDFDPPKPRKVKGVVENLAWGQLLELMNKRREAFEKQKEESKITDRLFYCANFIQSTMNSSYVNFYDSQKASKKDFSYSAYQEHIKKIYLLKFKYDKRYKEECAPYFSQEEVLTCEMDQQKAN